MEYLAIATGFVVLALISAIGGTLVFLMWTGKINLTKVISENDGTGSMSRLQFLIFTFVIAGSVLVLTLETGEFPVLGADVLALLGISGTSYVAAKGIQHSGGGVAEAAAQKALKAQEAAEEAAKKAGGDV